ncbi:hypothetical protein [Nitrosopumilus sp.]|uniref:hypothetical protein n=1 Tax=Nitrosopumilus sp. TaxID=2024843 RepID=UPI0034A06DBA
MVGISTDDRIEKIREKYKNRTCIWCDDNLKKDCYDGCECIFCSFPNKVYSWEEYPNLNECIRKDVQFFNELFDAGLIKEDNLARNWRRTQLPVLRSTGSDIKDWTAFDLESSGERKIIPNSPEDFTILSPYLKKFPDRRRNDGFPYHCGLCNEGNKTQYFIKNIAKKECIGLGGICGYAFHYSDQVAEDIKTNMLIIIRKIFKKNKLKIQKTVKEKLTSYPDKVWLKSLPKRIRDYDTGHVYISPENLAKFLLGLEEKGIDVFNEKKKNGIKTTIDTKEPLEQTSEEKSTHVIEKNSKESPLMKDYGIMILGIIEKLRGSSMYSVNKDQIIQELKKHGMPEIEIEEYIKRMLEREEIYEFTKNSYKIP